VLPTKEGYAETDSHLALSEPVIVPTKLGQVVVLYQDENWRLVRHLKIGYLDVFYRKKPLESWERIPLSLDWRRNTYPMTAVGTSRGLFIVGYDVVANVPSGRRLEETRDGIDVDLVQHDTKEFPKRLAEGLQAGGIDTRFDVKKFQDGILLSGLNTIYTILPEKPPELWNSEGLQKYEIVEIAFQNKKAAAILRQKHDDVVDGALEKKHSLYYFAEIRPEKWSSHLINEDGIPWGIFWNGERADYKLASNKSELTNLFFYDIGRMAHRGIMDYGGNNLEGRVAWSQVYYLQGIFAFLSQNKDELVTNLVSNRLKQRIKNECQLLVDLVSSPWPGLRCGRYSIGREPILFALHVGRTMQVLACAEEIFADESFTNAIAALKNLLNSDACVEKPGASTENKFTYQTLVYRQQTPFWADGCNVPYNFVSGVVSGLLSTKNTKEEILKCAVLLQPILKNEFSKPANQTWRFWWGQGAKGWISDDGVSLNTPAWAGNGNQPAHISYRSMDAIALLA